MPRRRSLPPNIRRHGTGYRARVAVDGKRHQSPTMATVEQVQVWISTFRAALDRPTGTPLELTLRDGLAMILADLRATGGRAATVAFYENHARILFGGLGGEGRMLHLITRADLRRYIDDRRAAGIAPQTIVGKELFVLRRMRKLALAAGYMLPVDPFDGLRLPKGRAGRFSVMTQERLAELVAAMRAHRAPRSSWDADLVELMFATGLRRAEVTRLRVRDIDLQAQRIEVDGKTGLRYQPIGEALEPVLRRLIAAALPDGRLLQSFRTVEKAFARWQERLGEPRLTPHVLRHSYATAMAGLVGPYELMRLMGHASLSQTSRYFHGRDDVVRGALNSLQLGPPAPEPS